MPAEVSPAASLRLKKELLELLQDGVEGIGVKLVDEADLFRWQAYILGAPQTLYEGGYFKLLMTFPNDYPFSPPSVRFLTTIWHPNVYEDGNVCISILHRPTDDPTSGEALSERWNSTQNVRSILISIISMLDDPNDSSPANVDAGIMFRRWKNEGDRTYEERIRKLVKESQIEAAHDGIQLPRTTKEYLATALHYSQEQCNDDPNSDDYKPEWGYDADVDERDDYP